MSLMQMKLLTINNAINREGLIFCTLDTEFKNKYIISLNGPKLTSGCFHAVVK